MLIKLAIRNVVLIEKLDLDLRLGLNVLTGETGAGKSILLDSLGLALGERANTNLIRTGTDKLSVSAIFETPSNHPGQKFLLQNDFITESNTIILRRSVTNDGRSAAYINDQAASVSMLKQLGILLAEIHGQFDTHGLMDTRSHQTILDQFRQTISTNTTHLMCNKAWGQWQNNEKELELAKQNQEEITENIEFIKTAIGELEELAPMPGEEAELIKTRSMLQHRETIIAGIMAAKKSISAHNGTGNSIHTAIKAINKVIPKAEDNLDIVFSALERASIELSEADIALDHALQIFNVDLVDIDSTEERLFALKAQSRKHNIPIDSLNEHLIKLSKDLSEIESHNVRIQELEKKIINNKAEFIEVAEKLELERKHASHIIEQKVAAELKPIHLANASLKINIQRLKETEWTKNGFNRIRFDVATNLGAPAGPINKVASGGELARFLLALKVVLTDSQPPTVMIFDEVDTGIGGAASTAVGSRLKRLAQNLQVLVITHSPQVAAIGQHHWKVTKASENMLTRTSLEYLSADERTEEIARMLSGSRVTDEARAAAKILLVGTE